MTDESILQVIKNLMIKPKKKEPNYVREQLLLPGVLTLKYMLRLVIKGLDSLESFKLVRTVTDQTIYAWEDLNSMEELLKEDGHEQVLYIIYIFFYIYYSFSIRI